MNQMLLIKNLKLIILALGVCYPAIIFSQDNIEIIPSEIIQLMCTQSPEGEYIIRNNEEYQQLLNARSPHPDCGNYELPDIDFSKYILVGYVSSIAGCSSPEISLKVIREGKGYLSSIMIQKDGLCKLNNRFTLWYLLPKEGGDLNIDFKVIKK